MTEIGKNKFGQYGYNIKKVEKEQISDYKECEKCKIEEEINPKYAHDTGILGRSQLTSSANGSNIPKSIDETIALATKRPATLQGSEDVFEFFYNKHIEEGKTESEAYMQALLAEEEFLSIANTH